MSDFEKRLSTAGERWLEAKAAGIPTSAIEAEVEEASLEYEREIERRSDDEHYD